MRSLGPTAGHVEGTEDTSGADDGDITNSGTVETCRERELTRERRGEGRMRTMAAVVKFGHKPKLSLDKRAEAVGRRDVGKNLECQNKRTAS